MKKEELLKKENKKNIIRWFFLICILIAAICILFARYVSTRGLLIKEYPIKTNKISDSYDGLKIVHFSDLHYGSTIRIKELRSIVTKINSQKPDIIVFTGDLFEPSEKVKKDELDDVIDALSKLDPAIEVLSVPGNHDYETKNYNKVIENLDWEVITNTYHYVYKDNNEPLVFVGIDDEIKGKPDYENAFSFTNEIDHELYTIVLVHEPDQILDMKSYNYDLVLAGHSHLGQVRLPLVGALYTPKGSKTYYDEHYKLNNADLYINGGIGTSMLKLRFFNRPSINLYRFYKE